MRHNKKINHLGRTSSHREAMLSNMAASLIKHKRIFTTTAKAKSLRRYVEPLITRSKEDTTHSRRTVFSYLQDKVAVTELFTVVSQKVGDRPGGYTRILKTGNRLGDNAALCFIELVDFNENMLKDKKTSTRTRRSRKKATAAPAVAVASATVVPPPIVEDTTSVVDPTSIVEDITVADEVVAEIVEAPVEETPTAPAAE